MLLGMQDKNKFVWSWVDREIEIDVKNVSRKFKLSEFIWQASASTAAGPQTGKTESGFKPMINMMNREGIYILNVVLLFIKLIGIGSVLSL